MFDNVIAKLRALDFRRALHLAREVVSDSFRTNGAVEAFENQVGCLVPTHVAEHHLAAQYNASRIDPVLVGIFWSRAVGGLENGMAADVIDIASRRDANAAHLGC